MNAANPLVTIVIVTRNRAHTLRRALRSCMAQSYLPLEILVYDDASVDQTPAVVRSEFPGVHLVVADRRVGLIVLRNRGFRDARGEIVFSLDDDAYFADSGTVSRTVEDFAGNACVAAVAIPFMEIFGADAGAKPSDGGDMIPGQRVSSYRGCAYAIRRRVALAVGGYRDYLVHQGEERDLCIRLREAGYEIIMGSAPPIVHDFSMARTPMRMRFYGIRNTLLFDVLNIPAPYVWGRFIKDCLGLCFYMRRNVLLRLALVPVAAIIAVFHVGHRKPVSRKTYRAFRGLPGHAPRLINTVLPAPLT